MKLPSMTISTHPVGGSSSSHVAENAFPSCLPKGHQYTISQPTAGGPSATQLIQAPQIQTMQTPFNRVPDFRETRNPAVTTCITSVSSQPSPTTTSPSIHHSASGLVPVAASVPAGQPVHAGQERYSSGTNTSVSVTTFSSQAQLESNGIRNPRQASQQIAQRLRQRFSNLANRQRNTIQEPSLQTGDPTLLKQPTANQKQNSSRPSESSFKYLPFFLSLF